MSARKLSRLAGLVFVLAAVFGGAGAAQAAPEHVTWGSSEVSTTAAAYRLQGIDITWG
jgi:hypothetical protein